MQDDADNNHQETAEQEVIAGGPAGQETNNQKKGAGRDQRHSYELSKIIRSHPAWWACNPYRECW